MMDVGSVVVLALEAMVWLLGLVVWCLLSSLKSGGKFAVATDYCCCMYVVLEP